jgi:exodeoxyribonuclease VII small subunit
MAEMKFEKAMEKLEKIVEELEEGGLPLEESLEKFEEGVKLSRFCSKKLKEAEKKIEILAKTAEGKLEAKPFDAERPEEPETEEEEEEEEEEDLLF